MGCDQITMISNDNYIKNETAITIHLFYTDTDCNRVWNHIRGYYIDKSRVRVKARYLKFQDHMQCLAACLKDANCKSVDFLKSSGQCWMWSIGMYDDMVTRDYYAFRASGSYDHWESYCEGTLITLHLKP